MAYSSDILTPSVSAIVVSYFTGPVLKECIHALCADPTITELVIVNSGNSKEDSEWLRKLQHKNCCAIKLIEEHGNIGYARANNIGAQAATGDRLLVINPDAVIRYGSVHQLENARNHGETPCLVGGKIFYQSGEEQRGGRREMLTMKRAFTDYFGLSKLEKLFPGFRSLHRERDPEPEGPIPMPVVSGAFCYMDRQEFLEIGGFDESYFLHVEDIDFCRQIADAGGQVIYTPHAGAMHYGSTSKVTAYFVDWHKAKGLSRYFFKFSKSPLQRLGARLSLYVFAGLLMGRSFLILVRNRTIKAVQKLAQ